jgi:hypothetical protein
VSQHHRDRVVAAVAAIEPHLDTVVIEDAVTRAAAASRTLRRLAEHVAAHPQSLTDGPTSTVPVLHRLAKHLAAAGAQRISPRHPACVGCGQLRAPHMRTANGWLCSICHGRILRPCHGCGEPRRAYTRASSGHLCQTCTNRRRQRERDTTITSAIVTAIRTAYAPRLTDEALAGIIHATAPRPLDRRLLARQIALVPAVLRQAPLPLSRLILKLAGAHVAGLPRLVCSGCGHDAGPDGHAATAGVYCRPCARACPDCARPYRQPGERVCSRCRRDRHRRRGTCTSCQRADRILGNGSRCHHCRARRDRRCADCGDPATPMRQIDDVGVCDRCAELTTTIGDCYEPDRRIVLTWIRWRLLARLRRAAYTGTDLTAPIYHARATVGQVTAPPSSPACTTQGAPWPPANKPTLMRSSPPHRPLAATSVRFSPGHNTAGTYPARCSYRPAAGDHWQRPPMPGSGGASPDDWCTTAPSTSPTASPPPSSSSTPNRSAASPCSPPPTSTQPTARPPSRSAPTGSNYPSHSPH